MTEDIVCLLQDLGRENAIDVIANYIIRNPDAEDSIAIRMGNLLATGLAAESPTADEVSPQPVSASTQDTSPSSLLGRVFNLALDPEMFTAGMNKMIFVVNMDLNMGRGKQCAQVAHAALGLYLKIQESSRQADLSKLQSWLFMGQKKIVVRGNNAEHLKQLQSQAESVQLPSILISDAGCTQIAPGSKTVLALFGSNEDLDQVTGPLRLL